MTQPTTIAETLRQASERLRAASVPNDLMDAQTLLAAAMGCDRTYLIVNFRQAVAPEARAAFESMISRRASGEPLQYITGHQEFFGLDFVVTPDVLIPRPETEIIVEEAVRIAQEERLVSPLIVDAGTGSGCIAVALAREVAGARILAVDISLSALAVAGQNSRRNGTSHSVTLIAADLLEAFAAEPFADLIVSNPPYVSAAEMPTLRREVAHWEPRRALTDENDGLTCYRRLLRDAPSRLKNGGRLLCEIGFGQSDAVASMVDRREWSEPRFIEDLQGIPRTLVLQRQH